MGSSGAEMELSHVSSLKYAGMTFFCRNWIVLDEGAGPQLAYIDGMIHGWTVAKSQVFFRLIRFSFTQLAVHSVSNRLHVKTTKWQQLLDRTASKSADKSIANFVSDFVPQIIPVAGKWVWRAISFDDLALAPILRVVHVSKATHSEVCFLIR